MVDLFAWMEEPCNCGNVYSHPDGGDAICAYCNGATAMRLEFERLTAEGAKYRKALEAIVRFPFPEAEVRKTAKHALQGKK